MSLVDERPATAPYTGVIRSMDNHGDTPITWTRGVEVEENAARAHFEKMRDAGYLAYKVERDDDGEITDREQVRRFDPSLGEVVMVPPRQGG